MSTSCLQIPDPEVTAVLVFLFTVRGAFFVMEKRNSVISLKNTPFHSRTPQERLRLTELGPDQPDIAIKQQTQDRGRNYTRSFSRSWYEKKTWLTACPKAGALFCFPCLLFQLPKTEQAWVQIGITDLKHFPDKAKKHEQTRSHMENAMRLAMFGNVSIAMQLNESYRIGIRRHNEEVDKNRYILSKIIDCIKFCGAFELALRGHDESENSGNSGIFSGLVDFVGSLDAAVHEHLRTATVFRGTSKTVQDELLDCMFSVVREQIIDEIKSADFVSIQADETMDNATQCQLVIVVRYIDKAHNVQERFFEFVPLQNSTTDSIATVLLDRLSSIIPSDHKTKLISQTYDGASVVGGATGGVQKKVQDVYENAHYVHCYAHQLNLIMQQATSHITKAKQFFCDVAGFSGFFSSSDVRLLEDETFSFFLELFHQIMPHVDTLYSRLQKRSIDLVFVSRAMQEFTDDVQKIRESLPGLCDAHDSSLLQQQAKKRRTMGPGELHRIATEVCDTVLAHMKERFAFTKHLISSTLLQADKFQEHNRLFPDAALDSTIEAYPVLNKSKLRTELSLIYSSEDFRKCTGAVALLQLFMQNNLQDIFSETVALLKILITTPMTTSEADRCFSTLKRIKTFLRNAVSQDHLNALAMLSVEKTLVRNMPDFNKRVIERFACLKERKANFTYKK